MLYLCAQLPHGHELAWGDSSTSRPRRPNLHRWPQLTHCKYLHLSASHLPNLSLTYPIALPPSMEKPHFRLVEWVHFWNFSWSKAIAADCSSSDTARRILCGDNFQQQGCIYVESFATHACTSISSYQVIQPVICLYCFSCKAWASDQDMGLACVGIAWRLFGYMRTYMPVVPSMSKSLHTEVALMVWALRPLSFICPRLIVAVSIESADRLIEAMNLADRVGPLLGCSCSGIPRNYGNVAARRSICSRWHPLTYAHQRSKRQNPSTK